MATDYQKLHDVPLCDLSDGELQTLALQAEQHANEWDSQGAPSMASQYRDRVHRYITEISRRHGHMIRGSLMPAAEIRTRREGR